MLPDYSKMTDEELIERMHEIPHEYPAIINLLIARHTGLVKSIVSTLGVLASDRDDYIQEGMIGLYEALEKYDPSRGASFKTFASIGIRSNVYNAIASKNTLKNSPLNTYVPIDSLVLGTEVSSDMTPEEEMLFQELLKKFQFVLNNEMTDAESHCLTLRMSGASVKEIADVMKMSEKSVENAIRRARDKIRKAF